VQRSVPLPASTQDAVLDLSGRDLSPFEFGAPALHVAVVFFQSVQIPTISSRRLATSG